MSKKNTVKRSRGFKETSGKKQAQLVAVAAEYGSIEWYLSKRKNGARRKRCGAWLAQGLNLPTSDGQLEKLVSDVNRLSRSARRDHKRREKSFRSVSFFEEMGVYDPEPLEDDVLSYEELLIDSMENGGLDVAQAHIYATACTDPNILKAILSVVTE